LCFKGLFDKKLNQEVRQGFAALTGIIMKKLEETKIESVETKVPGKTVAFFKVISKFLP